MELGKPQHFQSCLVCKNSVMIHEQFICGTSKYILCCHEQFLIQLIFWRSQLNKKLLVWLCCLNSSFCCLNNITRIFITLFRSHVFSQYLNNVTRTALPNGPVCDNWELHYIVSVLLLSCLVYSSFIYI